MTGMDQHSAARGGPLRRAWIAAWIVTLAMGGTTMAFQVYHSITRGQMPWPLAVLYGVVPLLIAILVLEIVAEWTQAPWPAKGAAYLIMGAAMFLSASATGAVVLRAAPPHFSLLPGALLDGAELLAAYFIMNGPRAADRAARAEAGRLAAAERAEADERTALRAALEAAGAELDTVRGELAEAVATAEAEAAKAVTLARKLEAATARKRGTATGRKRAAATGRKQEPVTGSATAPETVPEGDADLDAEARVLRYLAEGKSASEAGRLAGVSDSRGRQIARLAKAAPKDIVDGKDG